MQNYRYSIVIRCSDDFRVFDLLNQIDFNNYQVILSITPNFEIQEKIKTLGLTCVVSDKGNTAITTNVALPSVLCENVLLLDSDCLLYPATLERYFNLVTLFQPDFIRPKIDFQYNSLSSYLTKLQRSFQYNAFDFIYEPCLLINLKKVLPKIGGYLFSEYALFTPDGELDYRVKNNTNKFTILNDSQFSIKHLPLNYISNLKSHWRYGMSEANILKHTEINIIKPFFENILIRYKLALIQYPFLTLPSVLISDLVYIISFYFHQIKK